jgi:hypothetical protein
MRRRDFVRAIVGSAAAWPLAAIAQQQSMPVIGFLNGRAPANLSKLLAAFRQGLNETGYIEGQNVAIEYRFADNQYERLAALAVDLVRRQVTVIVATGTSAALAAKAATTTVPIHRRGRQAPRSQARGGFRRRSLDRLPPDTPAARWWQAERIQQSISLSQIEILIMQKPDYEAHRYKCAVCGKHYIVRHKGWACSKKCAQRLEESKHRFDTSASTSR